MRVMVTLLMKNKHASVTQGEGIAIGHSFGATLSLLAEVKHPGLFKTIILLDPPCSVGQRW